MSLQLVLDASNRPGGVGVGVRVGVAILQEILPKSHETLRLPNLCFSLCFGLRPSSPSSHLPFQSDNLLSYLTVEETLTYTAQLALRKHSAEAIKKKVTRGRLCFDLELLAPGERNQTTEKETQGDKQEPQCL